MSLITLAPTTNPTPDRTGVEPFFPSGASAIAKSDSNTFSCPVTVYVGTAGDVTIKLYDGTTVLFKAVPAGSVVPCRASGVMSTGTTASDMVAVY